MEPNTLELVVIVNAFLLLILAYLGLRRVWRWWHMERGVEEWRWDNPLDPRLPHGGWDLLGSNRAGLAPVLLITQGTHAGFLFCGQCQDVCGSSWGSCWWHQVRHGLGPCPKHQGAVRLPERLKPPKNGAPPGLSPPGPSP